MGHVCQDKPLNASHAFFGKVEKAEGRSDTTAGPSHEFVSHGRKDEVGEEGGEDEEWEDDGLGDYGEDDGVDGEDVMDWGDEDGLSEESEGSSGGS